MDKITLSHLKSLVEACEIPCAVNTGCHKYTPMEDAAAYYCSRYDVKNSETLDLLVFKLNQKTDQPNKLGNVSFSRRITNMDFTVTKGATGLKNNSTQGKIVADQLDKMFRKQQLTKLHLRDLLNEYLGTQVL